MLKGGPLYPQHRRPAPSSWSLTSSLSPTDAYGSCTQQIEPQLRFLGPEPQHLLLTSSTTQTLSSLHVLGWTGVGEPSMAQGPNPACFDMAHELRVVFTLWMVEKNQEKNDVSWHMQIMGNSKFRVCKYLLGHNHIHSFTYSYGYFCIKKQRHHFDDKVLYSQSYDFSSSHVWMWKLDHKEGWALKNWCFWNESSREKTLESPLDSKDITPVSPEGNKPF